MCSPHPPLLLTCPVFNSPHTFQQYLPISMLWKFSAKYSWIGPFYRPSWLNWVSPFVYMLTVFSIGAAKRAFCRAHSKGAFCLGRQNGRFSGLYQYHHFSTCTSFLTLFLPHMTDVSSDWLICMFHLILLHVFREFHVFLAWSNHCCSILCLFSGSASLQEP